jgi:sugar phosphate permease
VITCAQVGGAVAPIITGWTFYAFGWRWTFFVFSLLGVAWAALFYRLFSDDPAQHPGTNAAERALIAAASARAR